MSVKTSTTIGNHKQSLVYEGEKIFYKPCGLLGHIAQNYNEKKVIQLPEPVSTRSLSIPLEQAKDEYKIVSFAKKKIFEWLPEFPSKLVTPDLKDKQPAAVPGKFSKPTSPQTTLANLSNNDDGIDSLGQLPQVGPYWGSGNNGLFSVQEEKFSILTSSNLTPMSKFGPGPKSTNQQIKLDQTWAQSAKSPPPNFFWPNNFLAQLAFGLKFCSSF